MFSEITHLRQQVQLLEGVIKGKILLDVGAFDNSKLGESCQQKTKFTEGQVVNVTKRTEVGICKPGGVARITSVTLNRGVEYYDVCYVIDGTKEKRLSAAIISEHVDFVSRPRRSLEAENLGDLKCT